MRYFEDLMNRRRADLTDEVMTPDCILTAPVLPGAVQGSEVFKQVLAGLYATFPDLHFTVNELIVDGDRAAGTWTMEGTHQAEWLGVTATGRQVSMTGVDVFHIRGGRISRVEIQADYLGVMRQLGAVEAEKAT